MALDPQAQALLDQIAAAGVQPFESLSVEEARQALLAMAAMQVAPSEPVRAENRVIAGPETDLPIRIYTPDGTAPFPVVVYFHGGGWVLGSVDTHDALCRSLSVSSGCVVVSVDYRLAPESKFPAAVEDAYAATQWVAANAAAVGADATRLAVAGDSAGGNLAASVSLMARDRGGPALAFQLLIYPALDAACGHASHRENAEGYLLTTGAMRWFWGHYLAEPSAATNVYASPLLERNLAGLAPAMVLTAGFDPLRDEGEAYAARLRAAGVPVQMSRYDGMIHGFFGMGAILDRAKDAMAEASAALRSALAGR